MIKCLTLTLGFVLLMGCGGSHLDSRLVGQWEEHLNNGDIADYLTFNADGTGLGIMPDGSKFPFTWTSPSESGVDLAITLDGQPIVEHYNYRFEGVHQFDWRDDTPGQLTAEHVLTTVGL